MKNYKNVLIALFTIILTNIAMLVSGQSGEPWTSKDLIEPATINILKYGRNI